MCTRCLERQVEARSGKRRRRGRAPGLRVLVVPPCSVLRDTWASFIGAWPSRSFSTVLLEAKDANGVPGSLIKMWVLLSKPEGGPESLHF